MDGTDQSRVIEDGSFGEDDGELVALDLEPDDTDQKSEAEEFARRFMQELLRLRGVRIDRAQFLRAELHKRGVAASEVDHAIAGTPVAAGITLAMLDDIAQDSIQFETRKSSAFSFAAGLPGGLAMFATVPGDITQFYVHAFRVMQKLAYVYGWQSLLDQTKDIDDETLGKLASLLGVMMGVGVASNATVHFATQVARPAVEKQISRAALTKTAWYLPMKQVLRKVGVDVTKASFARGAAKVVPVVGGVVSGAMTMVTLDTQSKRLMRHLRELPPPHVDAAEYLAMLRELDAADPDTTKGMGEVFGNAMNRAGNVFRSVDRDGDGIPDEPQAKAVMKGALSALAGGVERAKTFARRGDTTPEGEGDTPSEEDAQPGASTPPS